MIPALALIASLAVVGAMLLHGRVILIAKAWHNARVTLRNLKPSGVLQPCREPIYAASGLNPSDTGSTKMSEKLRVIFYQDHGVWLAQGLEHDICVQADNLDDLCGRFEVAIRLESQDGGLDHLPAAPEYYHRMWDRKSGSFSPEYGNHDMYEVALAA